MNTINLFFFLYLIRKIMSIRNRGIFTVEDSPAYRNTFKTLAIKTVVNKSCELPSDSDGDVAGTDDVLQILEVFFGRDADFF